MPCVTGGDLYPHHIHVSSADSASDDVSRFVKLRSRDTEPPLWLDQLLKGNKGRFDSDHADVIHGLMLHALVAE